MPRYAVTGPLGPEQIDYDWLVAPNPAHALYQLHAEALGYDRVRLVDDALAFADPAEQAMCAGRWKVVELAQNGPRRSVEITIVPPVAAAA